ncbi:GntR family transcriptional regulator [Paraburkholderia dipogonis]|uniref:GntR family transcriptional regulator n=1 Tax=Paraburkholderia dipogonis TaxID=1211383 RepID=UPI0038BC1C95
MELLQGVGAGNLREQVVALVRADIVSGRTAPGAVYSVPGLATELGVSTTPVREALLELSRSGLLVAMRNRGFRVELLSREALDSLFTMRDLLERFALETLARQGLRDRDTLMALADEVSNAVAADNLPKYITSDRTFHEALVGQVGNPFLTKMVMQLRDDMRLYGIDSSEGRRRQKESVKEHYQMVNLADQGNVKEASDLISRHILSWKPLFEAALAQYS